MSHYRVRVEPPGPTFTREFGGWHYFETSKQALEFSETLLGFRAGKVTVQATPLKVKLGWMENENKPCS